MMRISLIFDPEAEIEITADALHTRHRISPYVGERLHGKVIATYVRGEAVFSDGVFHGAAVWAGSLRALRRALRSMMSQFP